MNYSLAAAQNPSILEPNGLCRDDGKHPDGVTIIPWKEGCSLACDAKCSDTFATSNIHHAVREARAVAGEAEKWKKSKYQALTHIHYLFQFQWRCLVLVVLIGSSPLLKPYAFF